MKVLCIQDNWLPPAPIRGRTPLGLDRAPRFGEVFTVYAQECLNGVWAYGLEEIPGHGFNAAAFVPRSDICEVELVRQRMNRDGLF